MRYKTYVREDRAMQVMGVSVASLSKHFKNNSEIYANKESAKLTGILDVFSPLYASLAKLVRHRPFKAGIFLGSSPRRRTRGQNLNNCHYSYQKRLTLQKFFKTQHLLNLFQKSYRFWSGP